MAGPFLLEGPLMHLGKKLFIYKSMIIQIKNDIKYNHAIIKYFKSYIVVIILVNAFKEKKVLHLPPFSALSIFDYAMYLELVGLAHVRNNEADQRSAIID